MHSAKESYEVKVYGNHTKWYQNGHLHRTDGPAVEYAGGRKFWWINGVEITEEEFNARKKIVVATIKVYSDGSVERIEE